MIAVSDETVFLTFEGVDGIRIVGDRFVFQSELFFDTGKATLDKPEGRAELDALAGALIELEKKIPGEIGWVLRVDGHTDGWPRWRQLPFSQRRAAGAPRLLAGLDIDGSAFRLDQRGDDRHA